MGLYCERNCEVLAGFIAKTLEGFRKAGLCPCDSCEERIKREKKQDGGEEWTEYAKANLLCTYCGKELGSEDEPWEFFMCKDCRNKMNSYTKERLRTDVNFKLRDRLRSRIYTCGNNPRKRSRIGTKPHVNIHVRTNIRRQICPAQFHIAGRNRGEVCRRSIRRNNGDDGQGPAAGD